MAEVESSQPLRNSTGKLKATAKGVDIGPNYLRASTGSCHDACKYGTPHEFKAKPKRPLRRRSGPKDDIPVEILVAPDKRSTRAVKSSSVVIPDASISTKPEGTVSRRSPSVGAQKSGKQQVQQIGQETQLDVKSVSPDFSNSVKQESISGVKSSSPNTSNSGKQPISSISVKKGSASSQRHSSNASKSTIEDVQSRRKPSSADVSGSVRQSGTKPGRTPHPPSGSMSRTTVMGRKSSSSDASKAVKREVVSSDGKAPLKNPSTKLDGSLKPKSTPIRRNSGSKIDSDLSTSKQGASKQNMRNPKVAVKKKVAQKEGSSKGEATSDHLNGCSDTKKPENYKVPEKTLHMIEVESSGQKSPGSVNRGSSDIVQSQLPLSPGSLDSLCQSKSPFSSLDAVGTNSESEYTESEGDDSDSYYDDDALGTTEGEGQNRVTHRKSRVLNHEGGESAPMKMKFRRGKVIDPQLEPNSPKRLRFRQRSNSGNYRRINSERRRSFKARDAGGNMDDTKADGVKVVLRHQDVQEKKGELRLFNNVIEETANKLVGMRRSKVLALVGAFETVISLQEGKSSGDKHSPHSSPGK